MQRLGAPRDPGSLPTSRVFVCWAVLAATALVGLALWQGQAYWEYSDGVYSLSARQILNGQAIYRDFAAAQPPPLYYVAAAALWISDTPIAIRVAMALCQACTSLLVLVAVNRLTRSPGAALCAAIACFFTPWALREHAQLLPETLAAPLLMAAALAGGRRATSAVAGALAAAAVTFKLAFVLPALAIVLLARDVRRAAIGFAAAAALGGVAFLTAFGGPLWTNIVRAQAESGRSSMSEIAGLWAQAGWNLLPLLALAVLAWLRRAALVDQALARSLLAATLGSLLLMVTLLKNGSYLTVLVVVEPPLLCFAASGLALTLRDRGSLIRTTLGRGTLIVGALALGSAQAVSLIVTPDHPSFFTRPFAASGPARPLSSAAVHELARQIRRCPPGSTYAGPPYLAFVAKRTIAGAQPDRFLVQAASVLSRFRRASQSDPTVCQAARAP